MTAEERTADERAAERLSSAPVDDSELDAGSGAGGAGTGGEVGIGFLGWLRWGWRQLTSMRTALILLFLLSLAAVPGSLVPQTSASPTNVAAFVTKHHTLAPIYQKLGLFHVYSSFWFSAIYILLFVSLAGCIVPRTWQFVGVLRSAPPAAPRHLVRLPVYATWRSKGSDAEKTLAAAETLLRRRRFRVARSGDAITSEKGYLREVGNLLFHISLFGMLLAFAFSKLFGGMGTVVVIEGKAFSNNVSQYDDFMPSTFYTGDDLTPFGFKLDKFEAAYQSSGPQIGNPTMYQANVSYWVGSDPTKTKTASIQENHPLEVDGSNVYLTAHGYAPAFQVTDAKGDVIFNGPTPCLPQDANLSSTCAIKVNDGYVDNTGTATQLGFSGIFTPTAATDPTSIKTMGPHSVFPDLADPEIYVNAYHGDLGDNSGVPQSIYELDTKHMTQYTLSGQPLTFALKPGQGFKLPSGGTVTFTGVQQWANFTVATNPGSSWALISALAAVLGLIGSLFVQRRRIWVRAVTGEDGTTVVELAGLARSESARIAEELAALALDLQDTAPADAPSADAAEPAEAAEEAEEVEPTDEPDTVAAGTTPKE
ncbi:cytochrome c biogenesis protein ResB [Streptacidiphilus fuscans]|uniref:Cytochrome c biogenesis protein ResB n=1 Tax=Streptacidiphilus fuscans TaxID=2789292 RepID=A0A931B0N3_9ACTN|nr:cytochrome c biogenesis protein ResB [Streptacidiphilus fuscans]MBF9068068.1 cytochrome c biogenesis protein ResB [Streptacidiphilus fuscans]